MFLWVYGIGPFLFLHYELFSFTYKGCTLSEFLNMARGGLNEGLTRKNKFQTYVTVWSMIHK